MKHWYGQISITLIAVALIVATELLVEPALWRIAVMLLITGLSAVMAARRINGLITHQHQSTRRILRALLFYRENTLRSRSGETAKGSGDSPADDDPDRQRFAEADRRIIQEELFRQPDFGRDELMRLMGVDKNTLATIIHRFTGGNIPAYVNFKRMEYAVELMKQHPEYTLSAISEACGMKSPATFIRNFRNTYGMTPSEFRVEMEKNTPPIEEVPGIL